MSGLRPLIPRPRPTQVLRIFVLSACTSSHQLRACQRIHHSASASSKPLSCSNHILHELLKKDFPSTVEVPSSTSSNPNASSAPGKRGCIWPCFQRNWAPTSSGSSSSSKSPSCRGEPHDRISAKLPTQNSYAPSNPEPRILALVAMGAKLSVRSRRLLQWHMTSVGVYIYIYMYIYIYICYPSLQGFLNELGLR